MSIITSVSSDLSIVYRSYAVFTRKVSLIASFHDMFVKLEVP